MATLFLDLDGTLSDPKEGTTRSIAHAMQKLGLPVPDPDSLDWAIGPPLYDSFARLGAPDPVEAVRFYRERYATVGLLENRIYDGIPEALAGLGAAGHKMCLATSKPEKFARRITAHFGLDVYLAEQAGASLDQSRNSKVDVLQHALALMGAAPETSVMVGDTKFDIEAANLLGLRSVGVMWGFGGAQDLQAATALCGHPNDLPGVLAQLLA